LYFYKRTIKKDPLKNPKNKVVEVFEKWTFLKCPILKKGRVLFLEKCEKSVLKHFAVKHEKIRFFNNA
jgi:hypothetical protein